jgi:DNA helicase II / ATP-dependent DNA helicase PcrA
MTASTINPEQAAVIAHPGGPLRIMAGAGTGKTFTLKERIIALLGRGETTPSRILALTFTNKAVDELRERIDPAVAALTRTMERVDIDTYHAFGSRIVGEFGVTIGLPAEPLMLSGAESWILLWRAIDQIPFEHIELTSMRTPGGTNHLARIVSLGSRLGDELRTLDDLDAWLEVHPEADGALRDYARGLEVYQRVKRERGAIDFGDQIALSCELLARPEIAATLQARYDHILVDEFQDTNFSQSVMVQRLVGRIDGNVCVVGDPNQAIYGFRGAAPDTLDRFAGEVFPGTTTVSLQRNYRSTQAILDAANAVWRDDPGDLRGGLRSAREMNGPRPLLVEGQQFEDEIAWIIGEIERLTSDEGMPFRDIAVIVRKNAKKQAIWRLLRAAGIPAEAVGGESLYQAPEVREIIAYLRAIVGHRDDTAFAYLLTSDRWGFDGEDLYAIGALRQRGEPLQDAARRLVQSGEMPRLEPIVLALDRLSQRSYGGIEPVLDEIIALRQGGYDPVEATNVDRFARSVREFARNRIERQDLPDLVAYIDLLIAAGGDEEAATEIDLSETDTVKVLTAHAAKGLQFPAVFVATANSSDFGSKGNSKGPLLPEALARPAPGQPRPEDFPEDDGGNAYEQALQAWRTTQEQREALRVLYVALTRPEDRLYITWSRNSPERVRPVELLPALEPVAAFCDRVVAPPAATRTAAITIGQFAPEALDGLDDLLRDPDARRAALEERLTALWVDAGGRAADVTGALDLFAHERRLLTAQIETIRRLDAVETMATVAPGTTVRRVSFSQLDVFGRCPHRYYLQYELGLPGMPVHGGSGYGSAVHRAIAGEASRRRLGRRTSPEALREIVANDPESRLSPPDGESAYGAADEAGLHDPIDVYCRSIDIDAEPLLVEQPFVLKLGDVVIEGVIDRLHRLPDGTTEIVDYKTDRWLRSPEQVREGLQLPVYLLATRQIFRDIQPPPSRATMFFLRHDRRITHDWTAADLDAVAARIVETAGRIARLQPTDHAASEAECGWCRYRRTCEFSLAGDGSGSLSGP